MTLKQSESLGGPEEPRVFHRKSIQLPLVLDSVTPAMWPWVFYVCSTFSIGHLTWLTYPANNWHLFKISEHEHRHFREATIDTFIIWIWSPGVLACTFEALMDPKVQNKIQNLDYKRAGRWLDPTCFPSSPTWPCRVLGSRPSVQHPLFDTHQHKLSDAACALSLRDKQPLTKSGDPEPRG